MYWEQHPLCAIELPEAPGTAEYFLAHSQLRDDDIERYSKHLYQFSQLRGRRVLDLGCGPGWLVENYARGGAEVVGVDLTHRALELTQRRLQLGDLGAGLVQANLEDLPFATSSVDFVSCAGVLHHTPTPERGVAEIHRVLKPGGGALVSLYYKNVLLRPRFWPLTRLAVRILFQKVPGRAIARSETVEDMVRTYDGDGNPLGRAYARFEALRLFGAFRVERVEVHYFPRRFLPLGRRMPELLFRLLDRFVGTMIFLQLRKRHELRESVVDDR